ncbi:hypothetical protein E2P63_03710 [Candidatus Bathyarchaeota archaeon]|nr:hypothetical protein E2P63_03710 [Candidatus Bathyarchaeota archaeon]
MSNIQLKIEAQINPTEESEKVKQAVENIFGAITFKIKPKTWGQLLIGETSGTVGLTKLSNIIKREQIVSAARKVLRNSATETKITFYLNKQVAYAGHISFSQQSAESPLGPIKIEIQCDNTQKLIDWLTPRRPK